ncbi:nitroreductase family protein [Rubritalea tangerina]|uniref:Putative NAD(P)H nitroreductase n=1 Tax=Rubritalea tangerina TaxID=430798 RepID=A0ABW4ZB72_9BACT
MQADAVSQLIAHRRSIKPALMDATQPISQELWQQLFEAANWAPNHGLTEPWRFFVYSGESRGKIAEALQASYKAETAEGEFRPEKYEKMGKNPWLAHSVVALVMKRDPKRKVPEVEEIEAVACAVQNLHLLASAVGLGVFWSSPAVTYGPSFAEALEIGSEDKCLGLLYVGWPKEGSEWPVSKRTDAMAKVAFK